MQTYTKIGVQGTSLSRILLAEACQLHWNMAPLPPITVEQWGKPTFQLPQHHFNLSHSGHIAICCLDTAPVGVDIQLPRPSRTAFLDKLCSLEERQWLLSKEDSPLAFALLWAMKESLCKYTGRGLTRPLSNLVVPLPSILPSDDNWCHHAGQNGTIFSLCLLHGGMVSVCGTAPVNIQNCTLP